MLAFLKMEITKFNECVTYRFTIVFMCTDSVFTHMIHYNVGSLS